MIRRASRKSWCRICREDIEPPLFPYIDRIAFDNGRRIVALDIEGKRRPYRTHDGRFYLRIGSDKREATAEELAALFDESRPLRYESLPALGAAIADIDEAHLWSFVREFAGDAFENAGANGYPTAEVLARDLLLATDYRRRSCAHCCRAAVVWPRRTRGRTAAAFGSDGNAVCRRYDSVAGG